MTRARPGGLRRQLWLACVLLVVAPLVVVWGLGLWDVLDARAQAAHLRRVEPTLIEAIEGSRLEAVADELDVFVRVIDRQGRVVVEGDPASGERRLFETEPLSCVADFFFGPEGAPRLAEVDAEMGPLAARPEIQRALAGEVATVRRASASGHMHVEYRAVPLGDDRVLVATTGSRRSARSLFDSRYELLKLTLGLVLAAMIVGSWLSWTIVRPIERLRRQVHVYLRTGEGGGLELQRRDELGALARDFEALRARLHARLEHASGTAADLAHEVKTPATTIATAGELIADGAPADETQRRRMAAALADASDRLRRATEAMLELARLDQQVAEEPRALTDLRALVHRVVEASLATDDRGPPVVVEPADDAPLHISASPRVGEALSNLVDNARTFAQTSVRIEVSRVNGRARIDVADDGPGIDPRERTEVFSRFYSVRPAGHPRGSGLGLPIAASIAHAHGGSLSLVDVPSGARFRLELPLEP